MMQVEKRNARKTAETRILTVRLAISLSCEVKTAHQPTGLCIFFIICSQLKGVACLHDISSALAVEFNKVKMVFGCERDGNFDQIKKRP
jgi:hypothetical protein